MIKKALLLLLGIFVWVFAWLIIPTTLMYLNIIFGLPVYFNNVLSTFGLTLFTLGFCGTLYTIHEHFSTGRVTPVVIEKPKKFIAKGLYKYVRNPMYIGISLTFLGLYMIFGYLLLLVYAICAALVFHLIVVYFEEPQLKKIFGSEYTDYTKKVPRWLPKVS